MRWRRLLGEAKLFDPDHMLFYGVLIEPPVEGRYSGATSAIRALGFMIDYNGDITPFVRRDGSRHA